MLCNSLAESREMCFDDANDNSLLVKNIVNVLRTASEGMPIINGFSKRTVELAVLIPFLL